MTIDKRPIGLPIEEPSLATWWPRLDFAFVDAGNEYVATGGAQSGGSADIQFGVVYTGTGGAQSGGTATVEVSHAYVATGGAQSGGSADIQFGVAYVGTGGAQSGGASTPSYEYIAQGGAQSGGAADVVYTQVIPSLTISGTIRVQSLPQNIRVQVAESSIVVTLLSEAA